MRTKSVQKLTIFSRGARLLIIERAHAIIPTMKAGHRLMNVIKTNGIVERSITKSCIPGLTPIYTTMSTAVIIKPIKNGDNFLDKAY